MAEADMGITEMAMAGGRAAPRRGEHFVRFYFEAVQNHTKSDEAGRAIFEDKEFVEIRAPGNRTTVINREVRPQDKSMFHEQYAAWKNSEDQGSVEGTPLAAWPMITKSLQEELRFLNVLTVENLAEMPDSSGQGMMGFHNLKKRAQLFLEAAEGNAVQEKLSAELEERDNRIEVLERQLEGLAAKIEELTEDE